MVTMRARVEFGSVSLARIAQLAHEHWGGLDRNERIVASACNAAPLYMLDFGKAVRAACDRESHETVLREADRITDSYRRATEDLIHTAMAVAAEEGNGRVLRVLHEGLQRLHGTTVLGPFELLVDPYPQDAVPEQEAREMSRDLREDAIRQAAPIAMSTPEFVRFCRDNTARQPKG